MSTTQLLDPRYDASRVIRAPRGTSLSCKSWLTEAPFRMLQNNLDAEVAEDPKNLVVYGGIGRAARNWECFDKILETLKELNDDETLLVQSGKPVGVFKTHTNAPRVLIANSNLVPKWANWEHFNELDRKGLFMYGQMTAGSWIYIGSQGIVQGTFETFVEAGRQHYNGDWTGKWILTAGLGGMGGAQPLAATLAGAVSLHIECQQSSIDFRLRTRYVDKQAKDIDDALSLIQQHCAAGEAVSIALLGNAADILPELVKRAKAGSIKPDLVTDQTSAHDLINGYLPRGWSVAQWKAAQRDPAQHARLTADAAQSCAVHVQAMLDFQALGIPTVDYGNNIRQVAKDVGVANAFDFPGFVPAYIRPLFCQGKGPFRWVALSGDPADIAATDRAVLEERPEELGGASLGEALRQMARFFNLLLDDFHCRLDSDVHRARLVVAPAPGRAPNAFGYEALLAMQYGLACWLGGRRIALLSAEFAYPAPPAEAEYALVYSGNLRFDRAETAICFERALLKLPVLQNRRTLQPFLRQAPGNILLKYRNREGLAARIRHGLRAVEPAAWPDFQHFANQLGMTTSTLRRRLDDEGESFQSIKNRLRSELAVGLLRHSDKDMLDIALALGFADASAFHRAFKKWSGAGPGAYRQRRQQG